MNIQLCSIFFALCVIECVTSVVYNRLFDDLFSSYNRLIRPARTPNDTINIKFKLKLTQLVDVHEKHQVVTTHGWLLHKWYDYRLSWISQHYGNVTRFAVPGEVIWLPDVILYNNVHGSPSVGAVTKAHIHHDGLIVSLFGNRPLYIIQCAKLMSSGEDVVKGFPYDEQECEMKFGSWTYSGTQLDMIHLKSDQVENATKDGEIVWNVENGVDISQYQESVEWDLLSVKSTRHRKWYPCCDYPSVDITYYLNIRRKKLFYTVNLIIPCVALAALTSWVFYLPCESHNKIELCINVLVSLTVFFLVLIDIIPPTSLVIPFIGKYLVFTMFIVTLSVILTVVVENIHFRDADCPMPPWMRTLFIEKLGKKLLISRRTAKSSLYRKILYRKNIDAINTMHILERQFNKTLFEIEMKSQVKEEEEQETKRTPIFMQLPMVNRSKSFKPGKTAPSTATRARTIRRLQSQDRGKMDKVQSSGDINKISDHEKTLSRREILRKAERNVHYIAQHLTEMRKADESQCDWRFVSLVVDRILLIVFGCVITFGTLFATLSAPALTDQRKPINVLPQDIIAHPNY